MEQKKAIYKVSAKSSFAEITECFAYDKICIGLYSYDESAEKGSRITNQVLSYFSILEAAYLGTKLSSQILTKDGVTTPFILKAIINNREAKESGKHPSEVYQSLGGKIDKETGKVISRQFRIEAGNKYPLVLRGFQGPGEKTSQGLFKPAYNFTTAEQKVNVPLSEEDSIKFGLALLKMVDMYYQLNNNKFV